MRLLFGQTMSPKSNGPKKRKLLLCAEDGVLEYDVVHQGGHSQLRYPAAIEDQVLPSWHFTKPVLCGGDRIHHFATLLRWAILFFDGISTFFRREPAHIVCALMIWVYVQFSSLSSSRTADSLFTGTSNQLHQTDYLFAESGQLANGVRSILMSLCLLQRQSCLLRPK